MDKKTREVLNTALSVAHIGATGMAVIAAELRQKGAIAPETINHLARHIEERAALLPADHAAYLRNLVPILHGENPAAG